MGLSSLRLNNMAMLENVSFTSSKQEAVVRQLYTELTIGRSVSESEVHREKELDLIYLTGRFQESTEIIIPLIKDSSISMKHIHAIQRRLLHKHNASKTTLAFIDDDSTTVYYSLSPGPPEPMKT